MKRFQKSTLLIVLLAIGTMALFEYYAPGSLTVANSMKEKHAVALQKATPKTDGCDVLLAVPALSAGVLTMHYD